MMLRVLDARDGMAKRCGPRVDRAQARHPVGTFKRARTAIGAGSNALSLLEPALRALATTPAAGKCLRDCEEIDCEEIASSAAMQGTLNPYGL